MGLGRYGLTVELEGLTSSHGLTVDDVDGSGLGVFVARLVRVWLSVGFCVGGCKGSWLALTYETLVAACLLLRAWTCTRRYKMLQSKNEIRQTNNSHDTQ